MDQEHIDKKTVCFLIMVLLFALTIEYIIVSAMRKMAAAEESEVILESTESSSEVLLSVTSTPTVTPTPEPQLLNYLCDAEITYTDIEYEYLGTYFITAYCPAECGGSWETASGATCHRSDEADRFYEPTTCAIDRNLHSFGDLFYIEEFDRVFVAEDTGSAVKGKHLDLFYEDYDDVRYFPTGYYTVYTVKYVEKTRRLGDDNGC